MTDIITTKRELAEYLAEHDPEMLEIFKEFAREFGPAVTRLGWPPNERGGITKSVTRRRIETLET